MSLLDEAHFSAMTFDDKGLQAEILGLFKGQASAWDEELTPDVSVETWRDAAHKLKGSAKGIGFWSLAEACDVAETMAKSGETDAEKIAAQLAQVRGLLAQALAEIEARPATSGA